MFEVRGLKTPKLNKVNIGAIFYGTDGIVVVGIEDYGNALVLDPKGNEVKKISGNGDHFDNFLKAVRSRNQSQLNADILEGHLSSPLSPGQCLVSSGRSGQRQRGRRTTCGRQGDGRDVRAFPGASGFEQDHDRKCSRPALRSQAGDQFEE